MASSSFRDRTSEFRSLTETLKKIAEVAPPKNQAQSRNVLSTSTSSSNESTPLLQSRSEFTRKASLIGLGIHEACKKIARLAQLAKKSSMFNDPTMEFQELTGLVKNDITSLNIALSDLQTIQNISIADGIYSQDTIVHSTAIFDDLKSKLMGATKHLQDVLTTRTENIKAYENRKQIFSKNISPEKPFQYQPKAVVEPPPWSSPSTVPQSHEQVTMLPPGGIPASNQLRRRLAVDSNPSQRMEMSMLQQVAPRQETYTENRAAALHSVESTITELSGIFTNLATMVAQQGELAIRIDDNMGESLANVEGAHNSLLRHLRQISSNRWLVIKIFLILIIFLAVFIFFVA